MRPTGNIEFLRSRHFPDDAQGQFVINNVIGFHGTKQYRVVEDGSGFTGIEVEPLLQSSDPNFRPVAMQMGPDGALYIGDWFNPLIGHIVLAARPRRDVQRSRIWRVTAGRPLVPGPKIHGQPTPRAENLKVYEIAPATDARELASGPPSRSPRRSGRGWRNRQGRRRLRASAARGAWVYNITTASGDLPSAASAEFRARAAALRVLQHWQIGEGRPALMRRPPTTRRRACGGGGTVAELHTDCRGTDAALDVLKQRRTLHALDSTITALEKAWKPALTARRRISTAHPRGYLSAGAPGG